MKELHALIDYENVQPPLDQLAKLAPGFTDVWLFHGPHQEKQVREMADAQEGVTLVPRSGKGKNALDFHISFYLGYVAARHPEAQLVVIANDKGYDPMIAHARMLNFTVKRVGFKVKTTSVKKAPVKNVAVEKLSGKKPPGKTVPITEVIFKKAPAAKAVGQAVPKRKAPGKAPAVTGKVSPPNKASDQEEKSLARARKALAKMGEKAPTKLKSLHRHLESMLGKDSSPAAVQALVRQLERLKAFRIAGNSVSYG